MAGSSASCERPLERRERQLVGTQRPLQRVPAQPLDEIGAPDDDARLRAAEKLVAREADEIGARAKALRRRRLVPDPTERARAEVVDERKLVGARDRRELRQLWALRESDDAEVRLVHAQQNRGLGTDRPLVVDRARAVRRPHLDQARARAHQHVRDPEAVADLDELTARDDHLTPFGERGEREQHRRRVVVDDERRFGSGQASEQAREMILARSALAALEVVLEIRIAGADLGHARERTRLRAALGRGSCGRARPSRSGHAEATAGAHGRALRRCGRRAARDPCPP